MQIPASTIEPFEPHGIPLMNRTPETMVYFIDKALSVIHQSLQRTIDNYGHHSHHFDLLELRHIATEFGATETYFSDVSKGRVDLTYSVPNDPREFTRRFYFNLNSKHRTAGTV